MLARLTPMRICTSTLRAMAFQAGQRALDAQKQPAPDIRTAEEVPASGDRRHVFPTPRTMYIMVDGTGVPCRKIDTQGIRGKSPDGQAGHREIKVGVLGFYAWLDLLGRPVPEARSVSHVVSTEGASTFGSVMRRVANSRGYGSTPRIQFIGDGADWIARIARQAFPDAIFTVDFYHACEHLHALCAALPLSASDVRREYERLRGLLYRFGAESVLRRLQNTQAVSIAHSPEASKNHAYFKKRTAAMCYGTFRKQGLYIGSGPVEAACRTDVVARCKQSGMHWRFHNAIRICAIRAALRSGTFAP